MLERKEISQWDNIINITSFQWKEIEKRKKRIHEIISQTIDDLDVLDVSQKEEDIEFISTFIRYYFLRSEEYNKQDVYDAFLESLLDPRIQERITNKDKEMEEDMIDKNIQEVSFMDVI